MTDATGLEHQPEAERLVATHSLVDSISKMRNDLDRVVPHIINILRRDEEEHRRRYSELEQQSREMPTWPLALGVHTFLERMRRTEMSQDLSDSIQSELVALLNSHGFHAFGSVGEVFNTDLHEVATAADGGVGPWVIDEVLVRGLNWLGLIVRRAVVTVSSAPNEEEANNAR